MDIEKLQKDRFLQKDPNQSDQTKSAIYTASNPAPKRGNDSLRKLGRPKGSEEDDGAPNILTGTVIVSCFIQTSALPSRIELEGNDLTFFDDTYAQGGEVVGDTSRMIFTHGSAVQGGTVTEGFIFEKRASNIDTYDNVLSIYATEPQTGKLNYLFVGRDGRGNNAETNYILFNINRSTETVTQATANGGFLITHSVDGVPTSDIHFAIVHNSFTSVPGDGFSILLAGSGTGVIGIATDIYPFVAGIDLGSPTDKFGTFYGSVSACPLPTVENALEILDRIEEPTFVGERGHYGLDRKYFDDLTFPKEILFTDAKGRTDIEHNHMLGFLLKAVIELKAKVDLLENKTQAL